ncbi:MAG: hypothetical protein OEN50_05490 [Deltaproteobacteria bacterium]|nr:hypothetical protein [Deltaproteobacteria bacterium]
MNYPALSSVLVKVSPRIEALWTRLGAASPAVKQDSEFVRVGDPSEAQIKIARN